MVYKTNISRYYVIISSSSDSPVLFNLRMGSEVETSLLTTKLNIPPARPQIVPRPRLVERLVEGFSNQEIAGKLVISLNTTKTHLRHIFNKLEARGRVQAIARAKELKLL